MRNYLSGMYLGILIALIGQVSTAQDFDDQGEGLAVIEQYVTLDESIDLEGNPFSTYTLYIKGHNIARTEGSEVTYDAFEKQSEKSQSRKMPDASGINVGILQPSYLINLKSKSIFGFGHGEKYPTYIKKNLDSVSSNLFYKQVFLKKIPKLFTIAQPTGKSKK